MMLSHRAGSTEGEGVRLAEVVGAIAYAGDLAFGFQFEDGVRSCYLALRIAEELGLSPEEQVAVYDMGLLKDAGCTCWTPQLAAFWMTDEIVARRELLIFGDPTSLPNFLGWLVRHVGSDLPPPRRLLRWRDVFLHQRDFMQEGFETACEVATRIAGRLGMPLLVQEAIASLFEQWDGRGAPRGLRGDQIPIVARVVSPTFFLVPFHSTRGREAARSLAQQQRGKGFDPAVADAFLALSERDDFWSEFEDPAIWSIVLDREPATPPRYLSESALDDAALAFADVIDLKSPYAAAHSRRLARWAERLGRRLACPEPEVTQIRRAALVHDLGLTGVPSFVLDKPDNRLTAVEREQLRLHPYHGERIVSRVGALRRLAPPVGAHHERLDGTGFYRGLPGSQIPLGARIIAVADRFDELTHDGPGQTAVDPATALQIIERETRSSLCPDVVRALQAEVSGAPVPARSRRGEWPAGLTDREVEVLRLVSRGLSRRQIAAALVLSENTVRHHLEHIYGKLGVSTRVAATLFAMEHDLLP